MTESTGRRFEPLFIQTPHARLFAILHHPEPPTPCIGTIILVPAFAEEMNRCRYMVAEQSRRLAARGWQVLIPDLYGTGDSEGEFCAASWDGWRDNICACIDWVSDRDNTAGVALWGIRLGAALAMSVAGMQPAIERLLLWQPVLKGSVALNQLLRMRMGAAISMGQAAESTKELRARLRNGESLRIGGYDISPAMADAVEAANIVDGVCPQPLRVDWFEVSSSDPPSLSPASRNATELWQSAGHQINAHCVQDPPYWQVHERAIAVNLLDATTAQFPQG
jgi:exosortase A-associated hydrolase 2